jgi:hypothetical protein
MNQENTQNNKKRATGFALNPQNINLKGAPPKEFSITNALKEILSERNPSTKIERYKELLQKALQMAMRGDGDMLKYLINRIEGMPKGSDTNIAVAVQNITYSPADRLEVAYRLVAEKYNKSVDDLELLLKQEWDNY